jgi:hypothetical protein
VTCPVCCFKFSSETSLKLHLERFHENCGENAAGKEAGSVVALQKMEFQCPSCPEFKTDLRIKLKNHLSKVKVEFRLIKYYLNIFKVDFHLIMCGLWFNFICRNAQQEQELRYRRK